MTVKKTKSKKSSKKASPRAKSKRLKSQTTASEKPKFIVGIGSSAGGLEALRNLFGALTEAPSMAFIVVQHLAPLHRSRLVEILSHSTGLTVKEVKDGEIPRARTIYITPPNADVVMDRGQLKLSPPHAAIGPKPSIDYFFKSLAECVAESAIGIILSGTGSDGSHGVRAIKAAGGFTISQTVATAKYDGMPRAAIHTGSVDLELSPEEIAQELARFNGIIRKQETDKNRSAEDAPFDEIFSILQNESGACFTDYKQSTVRRRIERRVIATRCDSVVDYLEYLKAHRTEAAHLFQDILISVTSFFRDAESFAQLRPFIENKVKEKNDGTSFRCWVIGCATGEEAYSLAILISEAIEKFSKNISIQIFATDLDEQALYIARRGVYSGASFEEFPSDLRSKYFNPLDDQYQIKGRIRDSIVFAKHNVGEDPPFLSTDLVSCRNVLIYFNQKLQEKVFKTIHYSLNSEGILFLGRSENVPHTVESFFKTEDKQSKIYTCTECKTEFPRTIHRSSFNYNGANLPLSAKKPTADGGAELFESMIAGFAPDSVIVDEEHRLKHTFGNANRYLRLPSGETTVVITKLLPGEMGQELTILIQRTQKLNRSVQGRLHEFNESESEQGVMLVVAPLRSEGKRHFLIAFQTRPLVPKKVSATVSPLTEGIDSDDHMKRLQQELVTTKEHLQTVIEEHETSNEELQAVNEELQSANEELQSSNEELETTNEELQSTNEELTTLNQELNVKSTELSMLTQRHEGVQNAIVYPLVTVNRRFQIINFNPAARYLLRINDSDIGSNLRAVPTHIDLAQVTSAVEAAIEQEQDGKLNYKTKDRSFEVQIQLFRGDRQSIEGAVVSFVDNTEINSVLEETQVIKARLASIIDNTPAPVSMKDLSGVYVFANQKFCELTKQNHEEVIGSTDEELFGPMAAGLIRERDFAVLRDKKPLQADESFELKGELHFWTSSKFPLLDQKGRPYSICTISLDITDRVIRERQLELFRRAISSSNSGTIIFEEKSSGFETTFCSEQFLDFLGLSSESLTGVGLEEFFRRIRIQENPSWIKQVIKKLETDTGLGSLTLNVVSSLNQELTLEVRSSILSHKEDKQKHLILSIFDITQRLIDQKTILAQQEELTRYGRFSALGEIAAGISHEINTPLNVITTKTDLIRKGVQLKKFDDSKALKIADDIDKMAKGISSIVHGLKSAVGIDPEKFESASIQRLIYDAAKICEFQLQRSSVELKLNLPEEDIYIECYPVQIMQIIINLLNNAQDAVANLKERWVSIQVHELRDRIQIRVVDSGRGIDPRVAEKIMTPFFTTKKSEKGTGIGLSLSRSIARKHNGDLILDREAANTTFCLEIARRQD